jgi:hypothetical protein
VRFDVTAGLGLPTVTVPVAARLDDVDVALGVHVTQQGSKRRERLGDVGRLLIDGVRSVGDPHLEEEAGLRSR